MPDGPKQIHKKYTAVQDGRTKILPSEYEAVRAKYSAANSLRAVAGYYGVDKRTIQFIIYPERLEALKKHQKEINHHKKYYDKDKRREYMRTFRAKKRAILGIPRTRKSKLDNLEPTIK